MRFHVPGVPSMPITRENSRCAYTAKIVKFKTMMEARGHEVITYGSEGADVVCYEPDAPFPDWTPQAWAVPNAALIPAIEKRQEPGDFICLMNGSGRCQQPLAETLPQTMVVESGIGYEGTFSPYRVFESYAWMHTIYGQQQGGFDANGHNYDVVIPNYFDPDDFPTREKGDYFLYMGRMIERKGVQIAEETAKHLGAKLILAGGTLEYEPAYGEYIGPVGPDERGELMAGARALFAPTIYVEPFGGVAVEAQMCGTPVIASDWGAFVETVQQGVSGYRCHTLGEFVWAAENVGNLDPQVIRDRALANYSLDAIGPRYEAYFEMLERLWHGKGWYDTEWEGLSRAR